MCHAVDRHEHIRFWKISRHTAAWDPIGRDHETARRSRGASVAVHQIHALARLQSCHRDVRLVHEHHTSPAEHATIAIIQGTLVLVVCMLAGFRPVSWTAVPQALAFMALIAIVFAALGTAIGSTLRDMQGFQLIMNFLIMPIFFLSGALFPLSNLPTALTIATRLDPLSYGIDGLRAAFIDVAHIGVALDFLL